MTKASNILNIESRDTHPQIGLDKAYLETACESLSEILGDTYQLVIKSHIYHWNVVGPLFKPLHELTEEHYNELFEATDIIAERIRALGHLAPDGVGRAAGFSPGSKDVKQLTAADMVNDLVADHQDAIKKMRETARKADEVGDFVTNDMLTERLTFHEKALWMLHATVAE